MISIKIAAVDTPWCRNRMLRRAASEGGTFHFGINLGCASAVSANAIPDQVRGKLPPFPCASPKEGPPRP
jgi:hypothetical protein